MASLEMSASKNEQTGMWDLYENAAMRKYGDTIKVFKTPCTEEYLNKLKFEVSVQSHDPEPEESRRTIVDINMKEYVNRCKNEVDETMFKVRKTTVKSKGSRYSFSSTKGVNWGIGGGIGAQVMNLAMAGGSASLNANYSRSKSTTSESEETSSDSFEFSYEQEEKILVPPMSKVKAKITSYSVKFDQAYVLKFTIAASHTIHVLYQTRCQQMFCGTKSGFITAAQFCSPLPEFREEGDKVSFVQAGVLSWIGVCSTVDKEVEPWLGDV